MVFDKQLQRIEDAYKARVQARVKQNETAYKNALVSTGKIEDPLLQQIDGQQKYVLPVKIYKNEDKDNIEERTTELLSKIASVDVTSYIMDHLDIDEMTSFVLNYDDLLSKLTKIGSDRFTRESLLKYIQAYANKHGFSRSDKEHSVGFSEFLHKDAAASTKPLDEQPVEVIEAGINQLFKQQVTDINKHRSAASGRAHLQTKYDVNIADMMDQMTADNIRNVGNWEVQRRYFIENVLKPARDKRLSDLSSKSASSSSSSSAAAIEGKGVQINRSRPKPLAKKRKLIVGRGIQTADVIMKDNTTGKYNYMKLSEKHLLNLNKLQNNVLCVVYASNFKPMALLSNKKISNGCKEVINDMIHDRFSNRLYSLLKLSERRIIKTLNRNVFNSQFDIMDEEDEKIQEEFELLLGSWQAGNNNPTMLKRLKQLIILGINEKRISKDEGYNLLLQISM